MPGGSRAGRRWAAAVVGLALACVAGEAAADALPFDSEQYSEAKTSIEVRGVAALGDVVLVVYPYPCVTWGRFESFEDERKKDPGERLELYFDDTQKVRGYLVVPDGERFASTTNWEGPAANCHFYGLPRAEFPAVGDAIARLDAMSEEERWRLFSREPSVLRTGVALAMDAVVKAHSERSRVVTYEARRDGATLVIEQVRWTWGSGRVQDPRKPSRKDVEVLEPYEGRDEEVEAKYFAGSLVGVAWPGERAEAAEPTETAPVQANAPAASGVTGPTSAPATTPVATRSASAPATTPGATGSTSAPATTGAATRTSPALWYGGGCLLVALAAGLLLRRGRR